MYVCMYVCMYARVVGWPHRVITGGDDQIARGEGSAQRALFGANRALYRGAPCRPSRPGGASPLGCVVRTAHGPRRDPRAGAPSAFAPRTARCPLAADPGCNLPGQRSFLARWQMVAKPARRRSPRRHQQRRRRRSSSHSASRAVRLPHAAPIDPVHCTSGATMCTCSSMPMPRVPCADADRVECTAAGRARLGPSRPDGAARRPQADGSWPMPAVSWPFGLGHSSWRRAELSPPSRRQPTPPPTPRWREWTS